MLFALPCQVTAPVPAIERPAPAPVDDGELHVRVRRRRRGATGSRTEASVARELPGTQGDAVRVIESLPGIGRASFGSGELIVWGAPPAFSRSYVDGVPIPLLFHGSGLRSTLNGFFVGNIEVVPGAYGADQGRALAGMAQIGTAPLRDGFHGEASVDLLDANAAVAFPLTHNVQAGVGGRFGWIDRLAPLVAPADGLQYVTLPRYGDYQARVEVRDTEYSRWTFFAFGSVDSTANRFDSADPFRARSLEREDGFHRISIRYTRQANERERVAVGAWAGRDDRRRAEQVGPFPASVETHTWRAGLRAAWAGRLSDHVGLQAGIDVETAFADLERHGSLLRPPREGDVFVFGQAPAADVQFDHWAVRQASVAPYVELPTTFFGERLEVVPGLRLESTLTDVSRRYPANGDDPTFGSSSLVANPEPRLRAALRISPWLRFKAAGGVYHAPPDPADLSAVFGTPTLAGARSLQGVAGVEARIGRWIDIEVLGFVRSVDGLAARAAPGAERVGSALAPTGTALAWGGQVTLRHTASRYFTGWLSYTLSRSEVRDRPDTQVRLSDYDQTHLVTAVGSVRLPLGFSVGARFRLLTGLPRTPLTGRYFDAASGEYQPVFGPVNGERLPLITSVDVRVDKRFRIGSTELVLFLDLLNVLNRPIAEEVVWDPTYTRQGYLLGLPILADVGVRGEW